jgi:hypothetical protein
MISTLASIVNESQIIRGDHRGGKAILNGVSSQILISGSLSMKLDSSCIC